MAHIPLDEPAPPRQQGWVPFALGFRPFFILAAVGSVLLMLVWLLVWHQNFPAADYYGRIGWHNHEMLFGYGVAVVAGFLLTAVRNWTGLDTPVGTPLALLAGVWLLGRVLPWLPVPPLLVFLVDVALLPLVAIALFTPLWKGQNKVNRVFIPLLLAMAIANLLVHVEAMGWADQLASKGVSMMILMIVLLIMLVGGRVLPFFSRNVIPGYQIRQFALLERTGFAAVCLLILAELFASGTVFTAVLYIVVGISQALRIGLWYHHNIWKMPVLWVLHTGYYWMVLGLVLMGVADLGLFMKSAATHALTAGAIGVFTLGMMARVALGHSGRSIDVTRAMLWAFVFGHMAAVIRVFGVAWLPEHYLIWIMLSGTLWLLAFGVFSVIYLPILLRPRLDGRPG